MNFIKSPKPVFYLWLVIYINTFWSYSFFTVSSCMFILNDIFNALIRIWWQLINFRDSRIFWFIIWFLWTQNRLLIDWWIVLRYFRFGHSWFRNKTWRCSFFYILFFQDILNRFGMLIFVFCIINFTLSTSVNALI